MKTLLSAPLASSREPSLWRRLAEFARYFVASAGALCVDAGLYRLGSGSGSPISGRH